MSIYSRLKQAALHQRVLPYVGQVRMVLVGAMFYTAPMSLMLMGLTAYQVGIRAWATIHMPWLNLWAFLGLLVVPVGIAIIIEWKYVQPSVFAASNQQGYVHNSPLVADMKQALQELSEIKAELEKNKHAE